jgi:5-methylcytosine-specific restriction protein B
MSKADDIRQYCINNFIKPARLKNEKGVFICVGDVHKALNLENSYPSVCSAIGSSTFEEEANVRRVDVYGPLNGASTVFAFILQ